MSECCTYACLHLNYIKSASVDGGYVSSERERKSYAYREKGNRKKDDTHRKGSKLFENECSLKLLGHSKVCIVLYIRIPTGTCIE